MTASIRYLIASVASVAQSMAAGQGGLDCVLSAP